MESFPEGGAYTIYVKEGVYEEYIQIRLNGLTIVGDGIDKTIITGSHSNVSGWGTGKSATISVLGSNFTAKYLTIENSAGPENGQAVALLVEHRAAFYKCSVKGYQDTLYAKRGLQFYRESDIYGTVDFIFGDATAVFQKCNIYARLPLHGQSNTVTAQARAFSANNTGTVFQNCSFFAAPSLLPNISAVYTYFGRPWRSYSRVVIMSSFLGQVIDPAGWLEWSEATDTQTVYYAEYNNRGPGADTKGRVQWPGYRVINDPYEVQNFTVAKFISGDQWLPPTGIPYDGGL